MAKKTILVIGADELPVIASGAKQSHPYLTKALVKEGAKVKMLSYCNSFNNWG